MYKRQVRDYAAQKGVDADTALTEGMAAKSAQFREGGGEIYIPITPAA